MHTHSYVLAETLLWFERGTVVIETLEVYQIPIVDPIPRFVTPSTLPASHAECVYCTDEAITIIGYAYP